MSAQTATRQAQRAAERLMVDSCRLDRATDDVDPMTGQPVVIQVYAGKCRVQVTTAQSTTGESIGYTFTQQDFQLHIPASVESPKVGDLVTLTATPGKPSRTGQKFRVEALFEKTFQSAQRIKITQSS